MLREYKNGKLTWVDLFEPTSEEIRQAMETCDVPPVLMSDLSAPVPRSETDTTSEAVKVTIDFPIVKQTGVETPQEVKFIVTKDCLITARYDDVAAVHQFAKEFEVLAILKKAGKSAHGGHLFVALMHTLYDSLEQKLDYVEAQMQKIDEGIFNQREKEMVANISSVSRRMITFRRTLKTHGDVISDSVVAFEKLFSKPFGTYVTELHDEYRHLMRRVGTLSETLDELRKTNSELLSTKQNEIMKVLTIMAFITFPLTLISSVFGMNTIETPIVGSSHDFMKILGIMSAATVGFFIFFKYKRWI